MDDVRVRNDYMMGAEDGAFQIAMFGISEGRMGMAGVCLGLAEWALDRSLEYAKERKTFGVPLAEHEALQFMMADMAMEIFAAKYAIIQTAKMLDAGEIPVKEICISKALSIEMCQRAYDRAIQIHGGMGLSSELVAGGRLPHRPHGAHPGRDLGDTAADDLPPAPPRRHAF